MVPKLIMSMMDRRKQIYRVECFECGMMTDYYAQKNDARFIWNELVDETIKKDKEATDS